MQQERKIRMHTVISIMETGRDKVLKAKVFAIRKGASNVYRHLDDVNANYNLRKRKG